MKVGLVNVAYDSTTGESRKLIFVADNHRIKSYAWGPPSANHANEEVDRKALPMHTMGLESFVEPLAVLSNGCIVLYAPEKVRQVFGAYTHH